MLVDSTALPPDGPETEPLAVRPRTRRRDTGELLVAGSLAGGWRIVDLIASGGCGSVYRACHAMLGRPAALKVLHTELAASSLMVDRFLREARAVNHIRHPGIVDVFDFGTLAGGRPFFAMELLALDNLEDRIAGNGRFTPPEVLAVLAPVCAALAAAHRAGYVHRDLKARNIGFGRDHHGIETPRLLDFGIAKLLEDPGGPGTTGTVRLGTPHCMSPEQIRGERVDPRTDVYALGVLLHHLITGVYPFESETTAEVERLHLEAPPPRPSRLAPVSPAIDALVGRAMAKDRDHRPAGALAFLAELEAACS